MDIKWKEAEMPANFREIGGELYFFDDTDDAETLNLRYITSKLTVRDGKIIFSEPESCNVYVYVLWILTPSEVETHKGPVKTYLGQQYIGEYKTRELAEEAGREKCEGTDNLFNIKKSTRNYQYNTEKYADYEKVVDET